MWDFLGWKQFRAVKFLSSQIVLHTSCVELLPFDKATRLVAKMQFKLQLDCIRGRAVCPYELNYLADWKFINFSWHNTQIWSYLETCFWCKSLRTRLRFFNFLHPLLSHHYHIFWTIVLIQQCVIEKMRTQKSWYFFLKNHQFITQST